MTTSSKRLEGSVSIAIGLVVATLGLLGAEYLGWYVGNHFGELIGLVVVVALTWVVTGLIILNIYHWERRPLSSIGLVAPTWRSLGWGIVALLVGIFTFGFTFPLVDALGLNTTVDGILWLEQFPIWLLVVAAVTAGVTEEILFRGYVLERIGKLADNIWIGALVSATVFTLLHIPLWGMGGALQIGLWTVVVTVLYVRTRNLWACILMHVLNDLYAFIIALVFLIG